MRFLFVIVVAAMSVGCLTKHEQVVMRTGQGEAMPVIKIKPGFEERIALMDRYRLHDEDRKHMMRRPHVWVEEVPDDEIPTNAEPTSESTEVETDAQETGAGAQETGAQPAKTAAAPSR